MSFSAIRSPQIFAADQNFPGSPKDGAGCRSLLLFPARQCSANFRLRGAFQGVARERPLRNTHHNACAQDHRIIMARRSVQYSIAELRYTPAQPFRHVPIEPRYELRIRMVRVLSQNPNTATPNTRAGQDLSVRLQGMWQRTRCRRYTDPSLSHVQRSVRVRAMVVSAPQHSTSNINANRYRAGLLRREKPGDASIDMRSLLEPQSASRCLTEKRILDLRTRSPAAAVCLYLPHLRSRSCRPQ